MYEMKIHLQYILHKLMKSNKIQTITKHVSKINIEICDISQYLK